ncbi:ORF6N domain-containing protein [Pelotomaculum isophthalicicum]|uniref:ORF6N domain-containing protein n=1 Tax=Pelotomaculum isophthalicicum TaxID=342448 RepID=UPI003B846501
MAEFYGTDTKHINDNFTNNKDRYALCKHYFILEGEELKQFKEAYPIFSGNLKYAPVIYLWTEKGAWLHAKSLNIDQTWEV